MMERFCVDCRHFANASSCGGWCHRPLTKRSLITGRHFVVGSQCWDERSSIWWPFSDRCGPNGKHWEPKSEAGVSKNG